MSPSLGRRALGDAGLRSVGTFKKATRGGVRSSRGLCDDDAPPQTEAGEDLEGSEAQPRATDGEDNFQRLLDRERKWLTYGVRMPFIKHVAPIYGQPIMPIGCYSMEPPAHTLTRAQSNSQNLSGTHRTARAARGDVDHLALGGGASSASGSAVDAERANNPHLAAIVEKYGKIKDDTTPTTGYALVSEMERERLQRAKAAMAKQVFGRRRRQIIAAVANPEWRVEIIAGCTLWINLKSGEACDTPPPIIAAARGAFFSTPHAKRLNHHMFLDALDEAFDSPKDRANREDVDSDDEEYALGTGAPSFDPRPSAEAIAELDALAERRVLPRRCSVGRLPRRRSSATRSEA